ncbi:putative quinol monooxygenase [Nocardioides hankookensis]|uniref:Quinol monooxygenase n=1 Tax=Nocardioides hankookensis TaxID=443157 RepID=A0ABW1LEY1_9ACTN
MTDIPDGALHVVATIPIDPAKSAEAAAALSELAAATREEEGCYAYDVYESAAAPGTFVTVEAWRAQEDLDGHMATPHIAKAFEVLGPAVAGDIAIHPLKAV